MPIRDAGTEGVHLTSHTTVLVPVFSFSKVDPFGTMLRLQGRQDMATRASVLPWHGFVVQSIDFSFKSMVSCSDDLAKTKFSSLD